MERKDDLDFLRVTEAAALSSAPWVGKGDRHGADQAACDGMRRTLNDLDICGTIVIGFVIYGIKVSALRIPGERATDIGVVLYAVPGALIGMALVYLEGMRRERQSG